MRFWLSSESTPLIMTYQIPSTSVQSTPSFGEKVVREPIFPRRFIQTDSLKRNGSESRFDRDDTVKALNMLARLSF